MPTLPFGMSNPPDELASIVDAVAPTFAAFNVMDPLTPPAPVLTLLVSIQT